MKPRVWTKKLGDKWQARLTIGVQTFSIGYEGTRTEARWMAAQLRHALGKNRHAHAETVARLATIEARVLELLDMMNDLDPTGSERRHPEWPLDIRGDLDYIQRLAGCLNALRALVPCEKPSKNATD